MQLVQVKYWLFLKHIIVLMLQRSSKALSSLKKIAELCQQGKNNAAASVMGVVIDMTRPLYRQRDKDYIIELKIVDQLINQDQVYGILVKYCSVYVFSNKKSDLQICNKIGQIVYLSSFSFALWNQIKLQTKYRSTIEKIYTFDVKVGNVDIFNILTTTPQSQDVRTEQILFRANKLAKWFQQYYYCKYKPSLGINLVNNFCVMAQPFNMILKRCSNNIMEVHMGDNIENHLTLQDLNGNKFIINQQCLPHRLPDSNYLFIRNIKFIGNFYQIILTQTGYVLGLPEENKQCYDNQMNYCAISRFNQRFLLKNHKTCNLSKINYVSPKTTPIKELLDNIDHYENKFSQKDDIRMEDLYMVEGVAINFQGKLHMFHSQHQMIVDEEYVSNLTDDERTDLIHRGILQYLYEGVLGIIDRSSESRGKLLYVHLFTNEKRARFFEQNIIERLNKNAGLLVNRDLQKSVKQQIDKKLQNLIDKSDFTNTVSMLLEPIRSDVLIYRLTNTVFV